jgi:hypothetical protein
MKQGATTSMDGIIMFLAFFDQFSYIKHFHLNYQLKDINILGFCYFKINKQIYLKGEGPRNNFQNGGRTPG